LGRAGTRLDARRSSRLLRIELLAIRAG